MEASHAVLLLMEAFFFFFLSQIYVSPNIVWLFLMRKLHFMCEMKSPASGEQQTLAPEQAEGGLAGKFCREGVLVDELTMNQKCGLAAKKAISILEYIRRCVASKQKEVIFHCSALVRYI